MHGLFKQEYKQHQVTHLTQTTSNNIMSPEPDIFVSLPYSRKIKAPYEFTR